MFLIALKVSCNFIKFYSFFVYLKIFLSVLFFSFVFSPLLISYCHFFFSFVYLLYFKICIFFCFSILVNILLLNMIPLGIYSKTKRMVMKSRNVHLFLKTWFLQLWRIILLDIVFLVVSFLLCSGLWIHNLIISWLQFSNPHIIVELLMKIIIFQISLTKCILSNIIMLLITHCYGFLVGFSFIYLFKACF